MRLPFPAAAARLLCGLCWLGATVAAQAPPVPTAAPTPDSTRQPSRVVLTWRDDPARSQAVTWRTEGRIEEAFAEIAEDSGNPGFSALARRSPARTTPVNLENRTVYYHEARFTLLRPGTQYAYRVGDGTTWSEWYQFRTASTEAEPFEFIYLGDAESDASPRSSRAIRAAFRNSPNARFVLQTGDLVNVGESDREWDEWYRGGGWVNAMVAQAPVAGDREYARVSRDAPRDLSKFWRPQFALPEDGPEALLETVYSFDYQGVRVIVLNSERTDLLAAQAAWLEARLQDNKNRWTVVAFHRPVFSLASDRDVSDIRDAWKPILDKYRVDLVLQGHDHTYGRGEAATTSADRRDDAGTVYVVSVSGPKMNEIGAGHEWAARAGSNLQLYQVIAVGGTSLRYEARTVTGQLLDAFEIVKDSSGQRRLVDRKPARPATQ
jgi:3',5'-cyclic AMP phosphodiesterase CpdA